MKLGKYQKILANYELSYDDLCILYSANKIKSIMGALVIIKHAGNQYIRATNPDNYKHILASYK